MDTSQKRIDIIIKKYNDSRLILARDVNIELELRFLHISREVFTHIFNKIIKDNNFKLLNDIYTAVDIRTKVHTAREEYISIKTVEFKNGVKCDPKYLKKTSLLPSPMSITSNAFSYNIGLNTEQPAREYPSNNMSSVRFKVRASFIHEAYPDWRFDITLVRMGSNDQMATIGKAMILKLFAQGVSLEQYATLITDNDISNHEIEIEYIGSRPPTANGITTAAGLILEMIDNNYAKNIVYQQELVSVARYLRVQREGIRSTKDIVNNVITLTKNIYVSNIFPPIGYYLTDKADGVRALVSVHDNKLYILTTNSAEVIDLKTVNIGSDIIKQTIFDAELITRKDNSRGLYIFDCMFIDGTDVSRETYKQRISYIGRVISALKPLLSDIMLYEKHFTLITEITTDVFKSVYNTTREYEIDGLILTESNSDYIKTVNYKWKPRENTTIDFLARRCPAELLGVEPYIDARDKQLYILFVGISYDLRARLRLSYIPHYDQVIGDSPRRDDYAPVQFAPSANPRAYLYQHDPVNGDIHGRIVELVMDDAGWKFIKLREDRTSELGNYNDYRVAELN